MWGVETGNVGSTLGNWGDEIRERTSLARRSEPVGPSPALLITGAVVIGLGFLAWTYLGPDLRRYLKIHSM